MQSNPEHLCITLAQHLCKPKHIILNYELKCWDFGRFERLIISLHMGVGEYDAVWMDLSMQNEMFLLFRRSVCHLRYHRPLPSFRRRCLRRQRILMMGQRRNPSIPISRYLHFSLPIFASLGARHMLMYSRKVCMLCHVFYTHRISVCLIIASN